MKTSRLIIVILFALCLMPVQAQDEARLSERTILGTARYVGMCGAMTAIGGDPSSVLDNPAGLGLYRRSEVLFTLGGAFDRAVQRSTGCYDRRNAFIIPHASVVFSVPTSREENDGIQYNNFMLSYNRLQAYGRNYFATDVNSNSLGGLLADVGADLGIPYCTEPTNASNSLQIRESGYVNEFAVDWALNIANQWYLGLGLHVQSYILSSDALYQETFATKNAEGENYLTRNASTLLMSGAGCNFAVGLIYRPLSWLRLGIGLRTPTLGRYNTYTTGTLYARTDSMRTSSAPNGVDPRRSIHMPLQTSASVAFQIGAYSMIALQYNYSHASFQDDIHSLRAGVEVVPILGFYINAGYAYESTFKPTNRIYAIDSTFDRQDTYFLWPRSTQYASVALGYRGTYVIAQVAYQYRWQGLNLYAHEQATAYNINTDTHRIVFTLGWHQGL